MAPWVEAHRGVLAALAQHGRLVAKLLSSVPRTQAQVTIAVGLLLLPFLLVTAAAAREARPGPWLSAYVMLLGGFFLHAFGHLGQALFFRGYVPGLIGALLAVVPGSLYVYRRLFAAGLLHGRKAAVLAVVGLAALGAGGLALIRLAGLLAGLSQ